MSHSSGKKRDAFRRFWKGSGVNLLIGLLCTMLLCIAAGRWLRVFPMPAWIGIGLLFWLVRMGLLFWDFLRRDQEDE